MSTQKSREIRLKGRPQGLPSPDDFELAETTLPSPTTGQVQVRNIYMSVDPYMRGRMVERESYVPPFQIGQPLSGGAVGQVVASENPNFRPGDYVSNFSGWQEWFVSGGNELQKIDPAMGPIQAFLGALGMPGLTAWAGLLKVGELKDGERVFVSAASGAVGAIVCQIAKNKGCYVVGSAGSDEKCAWLEKEARVDRTINYRKAGDLTKAVREALPEGIDVYFENVGGAHLDAALANMRMHGRIAVCGMIEQYNATSLPPADWRARQRQGRRASAARCRRGSPPAVPRAWRTAAAETAIPRTGTEFRTPRRCRPQALRLRGRAVRAAACARGAPAPPSCA